MTIHKCALTFLEAVLGDGHMHGRGLCITLKIDTKTLLDTKALQGFLISFQTFLRLFKKKFNRVT
jgi:hypothetical protein